MYRNPWTSGSKSLARTIATWAFTSGPHPCFALIFRNPQPFQSVPAGLVTPKPKVYRGHFVDG